MRCVIPGLILRTFATVPPFVAQTLISGWMHSPPTPLWASPFPPSDFSSSHLHPCESVSVAFKLGESHSLSLRGDIKAQYLCCVVVRYKTGPSARKSSLFVFLLVSFLPSFSAHAILSSRTFSHTAVSPLLDGATLWHLPTPRIVP